MNKTSGKTTTKRAFTLPELAFSSSSKMYTKTHCDSISGEMMESVSTTKHIAYHYLHHHQQHHQFLSKLHCAPLG